ncbi:MAG: hypothetical protein QGI81_11100 [Pseudomonadales bacterium]|jgi:isocitrate/isopropylmalate dehydrogenase|nr:hypothetical protein [Pseudomonadales bacterium]|tara:strand:+ start:98 stop:280 length:183 start_codon:yes stop_codon:yes gene_type:complete
MSAVMMLNYLSETQEDERYHITTERIRDAYDASVQARDTTRDLGGSLGTAAFADAVIGRL